MEEGKVSVTLRNTTLTGIVRKTKCYLG